MRGRVRYACVMSSWLFNLFMGGVVREIKARTVNFAVHFMYG